VRPAGKRGWPSAVALLWCAAAGSSALSAQDVAGGRVVHADAQPVAGARVVLHRVGRQTQGPVDSTTSGRDGRFRFRFTSDSGSLYLFSARYAGVEYFSPPLQVGRGRPDTAVSLLVYDTSSTAPIELAARHLVIPRPGDDGTREVLDLVVLQNQGTIARVAPDTLGASWSAPLPPGSEGLDVGEGDVSPDAMARRGDSVFMAAPIGPGEKQLSFQYHLPRGRTAIQFPFGREGGPVNVLLEEPGATVAAPRMTLADTQLIGGRSFRRFTGTVPAGAVISVRLPGPPRTPTLILSALVGAVALTLALGAWYLPRRRPGGVERPAVAAPAEDLLDRLAALDARYLGRESDVDPGEWEEYRADRARLKDELQALLAARGPG
jgi:Carboxypeptidase regulatory-like domain